MRAKKIRIMPYPDLVEVQGVIVERGSVKSWEMEVSEVSGFPLKIPITVVNGNQVGPRLCITAGIHGCEYDSIEAAIRLSNTIKPADLKGTLLITPIINLPGFQQKTPHVCPLDNLNLNRIFPGNPKGSISQQVAYTVFTQVVMKSDYLIDLHGGDLTESILPHIMVKITGQDSVDAQSRFMAQHFDIEHIWELDSSGIPGYPNYPKGSITYEASVRGIPAIVAEAGERGKMEEQYVKVLYDGIKNVMRTLKMLDEDPLPVKGHTLLERGRIVVSETSGLFYPSVSCGSRVSKGEEIGEIKDLSGTVKENLISPVEGIVLSLIPLMAVNSGEILFLIVELPKANA